MRILHVIESLEFGGAEKVVVDLTQAMLDHSEVDVCCVKREGDLAIRLDPRIRLSCLHAREGNDWRVPFRLAQMIRDRKYDVVHSHSWGVLLECALAALMTRTPCLVHTVHGNYLTYPLGMMSRLKKRLRHMAEWLMAYRHDRIVTVSDSIQRYVRRDIGLPQSRLTTIRNGIPCSTTHLSRPSSPAVKFMTVGRLAGIKNHVMMLRAFAAVTHTQLAVRLCIVGDGPERASLEALARELGIAGSVDFAGFRNDVSALLANSDVFLMTSHHEGISIAILEAMCAGLPVIATSVGGVPETVQHGATGLLVADNDEQAMVSAMHTLIESVAERRRLGDGGQALMKNEFSIKTTADRYYQIYLGQA